MVQRVFGIVSLLVVLGACGDNSRDTSTTTWSVSASPAQLVADGVAVATLRATAKRDNGEGVVGQAVTFEVSGTGNVLSAADATTGGDGVASVTLRSTVVETKTVTVRSGATVVDTAVVTFIAGAPSLGLSGTSRLQVSATSLAVGSTATVTATIKDALGHPIPGTQVAFSASAGHLSAATASTSDTGVASVTLDSADAVDAVVAATVVGADVYGSITVAFLGPAVSLSLIAQPDAGSAGAPLADLVVTALDSASHPASFPGDVSLSLASAPSGGLLHGTTSRTASGAVVTFIDLILEKAGTYEIKATSGALEVIGDPFVVSPASPDPAHGGVAAALASASVDTAVSLTVTVRDGFDNPVPGQTVTLTATGVGNTLTQPVAVTAADGTTTGSIQSTTTGSKVVTASVGASALAGTATVTITPGAAASIAFITSPSTGAAGSALGEVTVGAFDVHQNATTFPGPVSLSLSTSPLGATLGGTTSATVGGTVAAFSDLVVYRAGSYVLGASSGGWSATSASIAVGPGAAAGLVFTSQPASSVVAGETFTSTVGVIDLYGNPVGTATHDVSLAVGGSGTGVALRGTKTRPAVAGVAVFNDLAVEVAGVGYELTASAGGLTSVDSAAFDVAHAAADPTNSGVSAAVRLAPADGTTTLAVTITVADAFGNPVPGEVVTITATGTGNTLTQPTNPTDAAGQTTAAIASSKAETKVVSAHLAGAATLSGTLSVSFTGGPIASITFTSSPTGGAAGVALSGVTVSALDATGNPAVFPGNVVITLGTAPAGAVLTGTMSKPPTDAVIAFTDLEVQKAGGYVLHAASGAYSADSSAFNVTAGTPFPGNCSLTAGAASAVVDVDISLTATVRDQFNNPVPGIAVTFGASGSGNTFTQPSGTTNAAGEATGAIQSIKAEQKIVAGYLPGGVAMSGTTAVTINAGAANAAQSGVNISASSAIVGQSVTLTGTVRDKYGNAVPGQPVSFSASGSNNSIGAVSGNSDALGQVTATYSSTKAEAKTVTGYLAGPTAVAMGTTGAVTFSADVAHPATSGVASSAPTAVAGGSVTLTATVLDQYLNPVSGQVVTFGVTGTDNTLSATTAPTDTFGEAVVTLSSTKAETKIITASLGATPLAGTESVVFGAAAPSAANSGVTASDLSDLVAGVARSGVTATVHDAYGNPVPGVSITFASTGTGGTFTPAGGSTDAAGVVTASFKSTKAEGKTLSGLLPSDVPMTASTASLTVVPDVPAAAHSGTSAADTSDLTAGTSRSVTVTVRDQFDNVVAGVGITFASTGSNNSFAPTGGTTDGSGQVTSAFSSTTAEDKTVSGVLPSSVVMTGSIVALKVVADVPVAANSGVHAAAATATAGGAVNVTATVKDQYGNVVPGTVVVFSSSGSNNAFTPPSGSTNAAGQLTAAFSSTTAEDKTITGYLPSNVAMTAETGAVTFGPAAPAASRSGVSAAATTATAGGSVNVTATVRDQYDNVVPGVDISFSVSPTAGTSFSPAGGTTNPSGQVTVALTSTKAEAKTVTGVLPSSVAMTFATASVTFGPAAPDAAHSGVSVATGGVTAGSAIDVTATVRDQHDNPVSGVAVTFGSSGTANSFTPPTGSTTNGSGQVTVAFSSTKAEGKVVKGYLEGSTEMTQATASITVGPAAPSALVMVGGPSGAIVAGTLLSFTVEERDTYGNVATSRTDPIELSLSGGAGGATLVGYIAPVDAEAGIASFSAISVHAAGLTYKITAATSGLASASSSDFDVTYAAPSAARSSVAASPTSLTVGASSTITATVLDMYDNPVPNVSVGLESTGTGNTVTNPTQGTGTSGTTTGSLSSTVAELKTVTGKIGSTPLATTASVTFNAGAPTGNTTLVASSPAYDDDTSVTVTVTLKDQYGNPVPNKAVTLSRAPAVGTLVQPVGVTSASGVIAGAIHSLDRGTTTITATVDSVAVQTVDVTFAAAPPSAGNSSVAVPGSPAAADGSTPATVTVTVHDTADRPIEGATVTITYTAGGSISPASALTNASGVATFGVTATTALSATVVAHASGVDITSASNLTFYLCPAGEVFCSAVCTNVATDMNHCGSCANACAAGTQTCSEGTCAAACGIGKLILPNTKQHLLAGANPRGIAAVDLNGDNRKELVVTSAGDGTLTVFINLGDGTYRFGSSVPVGAGAFTVATGQVNGDTYADVAVGFTGGSSVSLLFGNGDGTLQAPATIAMGTGHYGLALTDINNDAAVDLVTANYTNLTITARLGAGDGSFGTLQTTSTSPVVPYNIAVGNLDGTGNRDVAVVDFNADQVYVAFGVGDGSFSGGTTYPTAGSPTNVTLASFDGTGADDVAVTTFSGVVSVLLNPASTGVLSARVDYPVGRAASQLYGLGAGDADGDSKVDLMIASPTDDTLFLLRGNGDGTFGLDVPFSVGTTPNAVVVADLNGDSKLDAATANRGSGDVSVLVGNGTGTFPGQSTFPGGSHPNSIASGNLNGDSVPDVVVTNRNDAVMGVLLGSGKGTLGWRRQWATGTTPVASAIEDMDGDLFPDLVVVNDSTGFTVGILKGHNNGTFDAMTATSVRGTSPVVAVADVSGDDKPDIILAGGGQNLVTVLLGPPDVNGVFPGKCVGSGLACVVGGAACADATNCVHLEYAVNFMPMGVAVADVSEDGKKDVVTANQNSNNIAVLLGSGDAAGTFGAPTYISIGAGRGPARVAVASLNPGVAAGQDGHPDLAVMNELAGTVSVLLGTGGGSFAGPVEYTVGPVPLNFAVTDLNGDGVPDIITANYGNNTISVLYGVGDGSFAAQRTYVVGAGPTGVAVVDLDADGKNDVVVSNETAGTVSVLMGTAGGLLSGHVVDSAGAQPYALALGELDGDTRLDAAVANRSGNTASVLLGQAGPPVGFGAPSAHSLSASAPYSIVTADFNGDHELDVVTANNGSGGVSVLLGDGAGGLGGASTTPAGNSPYGLAAGFVDGDGNLDLVVTNNGGTNTVSVMLGNGAGAFGGPTAYAVGNDPRGLALGDLDVDGHLDVVVANAGDASISVLKGGVSALGAQVTYAVQTTPVVVAIGDLDGDGKLDVAVGNSGSASVSWLKGNGLGGLGAATNLAVGATPVAIVIADVNHDGSPDIVTADQTSRGITVLQGHGDGTFDAIGFSLDVTPHALAAGDVDGDGRKDLVLSGDEGVFPLLSVCQP